MEATITDINYLRKITLALKKERERSGNLSRVLIRASDPDENRLEFVTTNSDAITKIFSMPASVGEAGETLADLLSFDKMVLKLKKLGKSSLTFKTDVSEIDTDHTVLEHEKLSATLNGGSRSSFLTPIESVEGETQSVPLSKLRHALERVYPYISTDAARMNLNGAYLKGQTITATDGHRLRTLNLGTDVNFSGIILRRSAVKVVKYAMNKLGSADAMVDVISDGDNIQIEFDGHKVISPAIGRTFPEYENIINDSTDEFSEFAVDQSELEEALDVLSVLKGSMNEPACVLTMDPLQIHFSNSDTGEATMPLGTATHLSGPLREVKLNINYFSEAVSDLTGKVSIKFSGRLCPVFLNTDEMFDMTTVVMPMK